jgi:hypothetical protein
MIWALIFTLLGNGEPEIFYIDEFDKGVKEYVVDKARRGEILDSLKSATKKVKSFYKAREGQVKELKKKNQERQTTEQWFKDFFEERMQERRELQAYTINMRYNLQTKITTNEWAEIMGLSAANVSRDEVKAKKKELKDKDKNIFRDVEKAITENVSDSEKQALILSALANYEKKHDEIVNTYEQIDVKAGGLLADQNATKEQMNQYCLGLNEIRQNYYSSYLNFYFDLRNDTTYDEWKTIINEFNKVLE